MSLPGLSAVLPSSRAVAGWQGRAEFFAHHGVWAFGVRIMRLWSLRTKVVLLVAVMAVPLAWLMVQQIRRHNAGVQTLERRLAGLQLAQAYQALAIQFTQQAQAFEDGKPVDNTAAALALTALGAAVARATDDGMAPLAAAWRANQPSLAATLGDGASAPGARRAARAATWPAMVMWHAAALDSSQLCSRRVASVVTTVQALRRASVHHREPVQRLQDRLGSLRGKRREMGETVNLIGTVAVRINSLALNASVEASRAGDAGRGFAVVAQAVRALVIRSADSARRIGEFVAGLTLKIEHSGVLADQTGRSTHAADAHADAVHAAISGVAELTHQGNRASADILDAVRLLQYSTAENRALLKPRTLAPGALRGQGERLSPTLGLFTLSCA